MTYLYANDVDLGAMTSRPQYGYDAEDSGIASAVFQEPREGMEPTTYTLVPVTKPPEFGGASTL
ncbi:hypothetical protein HEP87_60000 [Streptomyces sp. S1D4-11]|nr:hypothetical protein [Streptomyces sp. S1D4-11]